jgi:hypothetical protein
MAYTHGTIASYRNHQGPELFQAEETVFPLKIDFPGGPVQVGNALLGYKIK